jgi:hypothetical protein
VCAGAAQATNVRGRFGVRVLAVTIIPGRLHILPSIDGIASATSTDTIT